MESWPIQCTRILLSWNHDRPWIDPRQCNYWNQKGNNNKSDCGAFALTAAFLICSKVSLCKQYTYMVTLTLLQVDTPYNLIDNYMDGNSTSKLPPPMWVNLDWSWLSGEIRCHSFEKRWKPYFSNKNLWNLTNKDQLKLSWFGGKQTWSGWNIQPNFGDANKLAFYFKIHFQYSRCGFQQFHWNNPHLSHVTS